MKLFQMIFDWILNTWIPFCDLIKGKKHQLSGGNKQRQYITVQAEIHDERPHLISKGRSKRGTEEENMERFQDQNNIELINFDSIEKA